MLPLTQVYTSHQFSVWVGQLGMNGAFCSGNNGWRMVPSMGWHLKGADLTPYSRMGMAVLCCDRW
ncbi:MAG: protein adenylyltransferase SelO family protein [Candidatus Malihini olakiniferum]